MCGSARVPFSLRPPERNDAVEGVLGDFLADAGAVLRLGFSEVGPWLVSADDVRAHDEGASVPWRRVYLHVRLRGTI